MAAPVMSESASTEEGIEAWATYDVRGDLLAEDGVVCDHLDDGAGR